MRYTIFHQQVQYREVTLQYGAFEIQVVRMYIQEPCGSTIERFMGSRGTKVDLLQPWSQENT